jgi:hypothetical protein
LSLFLDRADQSGVWKIHSILIYLIFDTFLTTLCLGDFWSPAMIIFVCGHFEHISGSSTQNLGWKFERVIELKNKNWHDGSDNRFIIGSISTEKIKIILMIESNIISWNNFWIISFNVWLMVVRNSDWTNAISKGFDFPANFNSVWSG